MSFIATSGVRRCSWSLILSFIAICVLACTQTVMAAGGGISLSLVKTNDAPTPVPSGQAFTYTLTYSYAGAVGFTTGTPGTLIIRDTVPPDLDVISATGGSTIAGQIITFTVGGLTLPSGGGTVQINVRFKPGVTCPDTRACNTAWISVQRLDIKPVPSNTDCVIATAANKWQFWKDWISGCIVDSGDVVYRIAIVNPSGNDIGGLNLTNMSLADILPPGAIITSVSPLSGFPGEWNTATPTTGTALLSNTPGPTITSLTVQSGWSWWGCYVHVRFPGGSFAAGQTVTNTARLNYQTPCSHGQTLTMTASVNNTLCDPTVQPGGWIYKWLQLTTYFPSNPWYTPSWSPGCCANYYVYYVNNGSIAQTGVEINDTLPTTVDISSINTYLPGGMTSVAMDIYCYVGTSCQTAPAVTITTPGTYVPSGLPGPICHIRWRYTGSFTPGNVIYNSIGVCLRSNSFAAPYAPVVAGDLVRNTVCVSGTNVPAGLCWTSTDQVTPTAPNIISAKFFEGKAGSCMPGCATSTAGPYYPGDVIRWRMVVANVGSATATPCTISDMLPSGFTYVGNPTYYYGPIYFASATNPTCCTLTSTVPSAIGGITSPSLGDTNLLWSFPTLPANCSGNIDYLVIEFDAKANDNPTIAPGNYFNTFTFSAGNLTTPVVSNPAQVTINGTAQVQIAKDVRPLITGTVFGPSASVQPGGVAEFRLRVKNTGMLTLSNVYLLDILPHIGDISVLPPYAARGSAYNLPLAGTTPATGYAFRYNTSTNTKNPTRSILFSGVANPAGGVLPLTPGVWVTPFTSTYSFDITGAPAMIAPGGTQDFFFTTVVPAGTTTGLTACNSFGLQTTPYGTSTYIKTEATPACVTVIPPDKNECDSIWGGVQFNECCTFTTSISNTLGNIVELQYNVLPVGGGSSPSGIVQSIVTSPCVPSSTIPASLSGTTSGALFFSPPCPTPLGVQVHTSSTTSSGLICVELIATIVAKDGTKIQCRDTICYHCDPAPQVRCDSMMVRPFPDKKLSMRTFTIYNLKSPASQICGISIAVTPAPGGTGLHGSGLVVDGTPMTWPAATSSGWTQITSAHGLPANTMVQFNLGVDNGLPWVGNVVITITHCDGQVCTTRYMQWDARQTGTIGVGTATDVPDRATLHMNSLTFSRGAAAGKHVRSIAVHYNDPASEIVAVTGATYPCEPDGAEQGNCNDIFESVNVKDLSMMIDLRRDLDDDRNLNDPVVTVVYRAATDENVTVDIVYYDENGQEVGTDRVDVRGEQPPGQALAGVSPRDQMAAVLGALTARPNPTSGRCDVGFTLPAAATVDLDLMDARGTKVATLVSGEHLGAGEHHRTVELGTLSSGSYMVSLRVNGVPSVLRVELTK